jgi:hypothetical protein
VPVEDERLLIHDAENPYPKPKNMADFLKPEYLEV